jgi:hypothetical protein
MRAERLGGTLGVPSTESSEPEGELLALSLFFLKGEGI